MRSIDNSVAGAYRSADKAAPPEMAPLVPLVFNLGVSALTAKASR